MSQGFYRRAILPLALVLLIGVPESKADDVVCFGDCDSNDSVTEPELMTGVEIALLLRPVTDCTPYSPSAEIDELVLAVDASKGACTIIPNPTITPVPTSTATATPTVTNTPGPTNTPGGVSNAVAGGAAVVAKSLGGIPSLVTAIVTGLVKGTMPVGSPLEGGGAGACPAGGDASKICTPTQAGGAQLSIGLNQCAVTVPEGTLTFSTPFGPITLTSPLPASCPVGVSPFAQIDASADVSSVTKNPGGDPLLNSRATLFAKVQPQIPIPPPVCVVTGAQLKVTGSLSAAIPSPPSGAVLSFKDTDVSLSIATFSGDCVPVNYTLTFNGAAQIRDTSTDETADISFANFVVHVDAQSVPTTLEMDGGLNFGCVQGSIVLDTVSPLSAIPGQLCPTGGMIQVTSPEGTSSVTYESDGSVDVDVNNDGTPDNIFDSCIDPMLLLCPQTP